MDWQIVPGKTTGTYRLLTTHHADGAQPAGWGLSSWNAHGANRNGHSSRVAVHSGDYVRKMCSSNHGLSIAYPQAQTIPHHV